MPTYKYRFCDCEAVQKDNAEWDAKYPNAITFTTFELNLPIHKRDMPYCQECNKPYERIINFAGRVWAPTAGGMR